MSKEKNKKRILLGKNEVWSGFGISLEVRSGYSPYIDMQFFTQTGIRIQLGISDDPTVLRE